MIALDHVPASMNQDEACNAWNSWCLLKTGVDQDGKPWPVFYFHAYGENRSTLFLYLLLPFQWLGGLNNWTMRLPTATAGLASIALIYYVAGQWLGRWYGLLAATLLAWSGWHVQHSRWGHESGISPLLVLAPLAALTASRLVRPFPIEPREVSQNPGNRSTPSWKWALIAGLLFGLSCYGYPAVRLFLPLLGGLIVAIFPGTWLAQLRSGRGRAATAALLVGVAITFGPLLYEHLAHPTEMLRRGEQSWTWSADDPLFSRGVKVLRRYVEHFSPDFLFWTGDSIRAQTPPGGGVLEWHFLPLLIAGVLGGFECWRKQAAARLAILLLLLYPAGDCTSLHASMHALRSLPGLPGLVFVSVFGIRWVFTGFAANRPSLRRMITGALMAIALLLHIRFMYLFFGPYQVECAGTNTFAPDLVDACRFIKPEFNQLDAVVVTPTLYNEAYEITLLALEYDPVQWLKDDKTYQRVNVWDVCTSYGKMRFPQDFTRSGVLQSLAGLPPAARVALFGRPGEIRGVYAAHVCSDVIGRPLLEVFIVPLSELGRLRFDPGMHTQISSPLPSAPTSRVKPEASSRPRP